jgi:alpha-galactosidase
MQGQAQIRTFDVIGLDPQTAPMLEEMVDANGDPRVLENVWIYSIGASNKEKSGPLTVGYGAENRGPKIGPEFTFGIHMSKLLDEPILIIKTAWGGKSLHTDFRPPSAGPFTFTDEQLSKFEAQGKNIDSLRQRKIKESGRYYRLMMEHVKTVLADIKRVYPDYNPDKGYQLAGFLWFQGWNDLVDKDVYPGRDSPGAFASYSDLLAQLIKDVRSELKVAELPFVIGVMGTGGPTKFYSGGRKRYQARHQDFRNAMAAPASLPEFRNNVATVFTENYWDMELQELVEREEDKVKPLIKAIQDKVKRGDLSAIQAKAARENAYREHFTEHERMLLKDGTSDLGFHYLGSAKILGQIGNAFAEANHQLLRN